MRSMSFIRECFENLKVDLTNSLVYTHCVCAYLYGRQPSGYRQGERSLYLYRFFHHSSVWPFIRCSNTNHLRFNCLMWCSSIVACMFESENKTTTNNRIIRTIWKSITCQKYQKKILQTRMDGWLGEYFPNVIEGEKKLFMRSIKYSIQISL